MRNKTLKKKPLASVVPEAKEFKPHSCSITVQYVFDELMFTTILIQPIRFKINRNCFPPLISTNTSTMQPIFFD